MRRFLLKRRPIVYHKPYKGVHKPFVDLNDLLEYNINTNVATKGEGTMLTHPSNFERFDQRISEKLI
jgi:hypothetical protein